jgi:hypothetical protein
MAFSAGLKRTLDAQGRKKRNSRAVGGDVGGVGDRGGVGDS